MTTAVTRAQVRAMLEAHVSRHAQACLQGRGNAVKLDIDDELNDAYRFILERAGPLAAEQFRRMYVEEELAFILDLQSNTQAMRRRILPNAPQSVSSRSQLPAPKHTANTLTIALAICLIAGLAIGAIR